MTSNRRTTVLKPIARRDFLQGVAVSTGALATSPFGLAQALEPSPPGGKAAAEHYPPALTGLRGSHEGSYEVAHALAWNGDKPSTYASQNEHYDLVIVGAGHSGLAAAWYWRKKMGDDARILILDNHDDFGGHAKRNEFHYDHRMVLCLGGAQNLENPGDYSDNAKELLLDMGIDDKFLDEMIARTPDDYFLGGHFGASTAVAMPSNEGLKTVAGPWSTWLLGAEGYADAVRDLPLTVAEQDDLLAFIGGDKDYLTGMSLKEKYTYCKTHSYRAYLTEKVRLAAASIELLDNQLRIFMGFTGGNLSVREAIYLGAPGLNSMGWLAGIANSLLSSAVEDAVTVRMFPDGNASIARLLTQNLIPDVAPQMRGVEDVVSTRFRYSALDLPKNPTRMRLNSTVVGVRERDDAVVEVDYVRGKEAQRVTADHCILACYNGLIPHICPELPQSQKEALAYGVKVPFVYASVLVKNGHAFSKLGATLVQCPGQYFQMVSAAPTSSVGGYEPPSGPDDPMALFLMAAPTPAPQANESARNLFRFARHLVYATPFAQFEETIRNELGALLGPHGFDHEEDIVAITVNRLPHGYAYSYLELHDAELPEGQRPHELGRKQFGRISIANSDSEARAYMDAAWDAAWRAVNEQTPTA